MARDKPPISDAARMELKTPAAESRYITSFCASAHRRAVAGRQQISVIGPGL
jgi:hypothetical protein